jgi:hypothetical protein
MEKTAIIVTSVVGSLGVLSAIFGFSAEGTKLTVSTMNIMHVKVPYLPFLFLSKKPLYILCTCAHICFNYVPMNSGN